MAFKQLKPQQSAPDSPEKLFSDLPRRKIPYVLPHQKDILNEYVDKALVAKDVALELPTGSGKTLVGLLIAEWRRLKYKEKIVYLCPTRQLVNQVAELASQKYGITVCAFTGSQKAYSPVDKAKYKGGECVAITTYSSLFNVKPFFNDADVVILDDAHAAESYISGMWSILVERDDPKYAVLHAALSAILKPVMEPAHFARLQGKVDSIDDQDWVDKLPTPILIGLRDQIIEVLDEHAKVGSDLAYSWPLLRDHLDACHVYLSSQGILIRPLLPPTSTHKPFATPKQRIYMSATLGEGGDLERLTGRHQIQRLSVPGGWDSHGIGRRFFIFPDLTLDEKESSKLKMSIMKEAGRSLVLVPSERASDIIVEEVKKSIGFTVYSARDLEKAKAPFVGSPEAVAVVSNRYDGIDFPGGECRSLFVEGLPRAVNMQERFLMSRMGALALLNERVRTRVLQAIGRCTRSFEDYSAVIVSGGELPGYLSDRQKMKYLSPDLQAELQFGVNQSKETTAEDILENFKIFIANGKEWEAVNQQIVTDRQTLTRAQLPGMTDLASAVEHEIGYEASMWQGDFEDALARAEKVLGFLNDDSLKGYRALWHYLAGSAALLASAKPGDGLDLKARDHFVRAKKSATNITWLVGLAKSPELAAADEEKEEIVMRQIEGIETILMKLGTVHDRDFAKREREVLEGIQGKDHTAFEESQRKLGELLGFDAGKEESDGSPDPWWAIGDLCLVFEDHSEALPTSSLDAKKARQASSHPDWITSKGIVAVGGEVLPVLVTPVRSASPGAIPHLKGVALWQIEDFRIWTKEVFAVLREMRTTLAERGDIAWRSTATAILKKHGMDAPSLMKKLKASSAESGLKATVSAERQVAAV